MSGPAINHTLIALNKKPETRIEIEKIPAARAAILEVLQADKAWWAANGQRQVGMEKHTLLQKVCNKVPINSNVFDLALTDLACEQLVLPFSEGSLVRFILLDLTHAKTKT